MDSLSVAGVISGGLAVVIAIFTHLKHSECCGFIKLDTYNPNELQPQPQPTQIILNTPTHTPHPTPELKHSNETKI